MYNNFSYNNSIHPSPGFTPFQLAHGRHPITPFLHPPSSADTSNPTANEILQSLKHLASSDFTELLSSLRLQAIDHQIDTRVRRTLATQHRATRDFHETDLVLVKTEYLLPESQRLTRSKKLLPRFVGPYPIKRVISPTSIELVLPASIGVHPVVNLKNVKHYSGSLPSDDTNDSVPRLPSDYNPDDVESILDTQQVASRTEYLVKWKSASASDSTWVTSETLGQHPVLLQFQAVLDYIRPDTLDTETSGRRLRKGRGSVSEPLMTEDVFNYGPITDPLPPAAQQQRDASLLFLLGL